MRSLLRRDHRLKAGIEIEKPIAVGILKIGELLPAKTAKEAGEMKGKKGSRPDELAFAKDTISAYRKIAANKSRIEEYAEKAEDVPTQGEFMLSNGATTYLNWTPTAGRWCRINCCSGTTPSRT